MGEIARLSHTHEAILNWLVLNPDKPLRMCADHFGYTQPWLSTLIHSDLFQHALKEKQLAVGLAVTASIPQKLAVAADIAIEKLTEKLEQTEDPDFILDATDKILHRMGYAPASARNPGGGPMGSGGAVGQQNNFFITAGDLEAARGLMQASAQTQSAALEGECVEVPRGDA